jgi:cysteine desulfurase / selenocysteine lyase
MRYDGGKDMDIACLNSSNGWRERIVGLDRKAPLLDGRLVPYINLDNAATTPPLWDVLEAVLRFLPYYSSSHRGSGFKSRISTAAYDEAHEIIGRFVGAEMDSNTVIFGKNTTEAINKLAFRYPMRPDSVVLSTMMEHHSNDLPWRRRAKVVRAQVTSEGRLDEDDVDRLLAQYGDRIALMTVSGASNVTGFVQPIHRLARKAHAVGARILVDAAQLAPHRRIDVRPDDDPEHIDFVALSAHKMYAPFGAGALVGPREIFLQGAPEYQGGGTVELVTLGYVRWAELPDREEAGSPNVVGAIAMAMAAQAMMDAGMESVERYEAALTAYALERLRSLPEITIYGEADPRRIQERVGVISFNLGSAHHSLVAAILGYEGGIGTRNGCFCAQPYVALLLRDAETETAQWRRDPLAGDKSGKPGMVRISFGAYNNFDDVDALIEMLRRITRNEYRGQYYPIPESGEYKPVGYRDSMAEHFSLSGFTFQSGIPARRA